MSKTVTFQIASDLHIEYLPHTPDPLDYITPKADVLILAGDIGSFYRLDQLETFLRTTCQYFKAVIYLPGNHEFYTIKGTPGRSMNFLLLQMEELAKNIPKLRLLNRSSVQIGDICIAGCTLWSDPEKFVPKYIVRVDGMSTERYRRLHRVDRSYIERMIEYCHTHSLRLVMVTHHCPTYRVLTHPRWKKDRFPSLYATNLDHLLNRENVHTWICGHIHSNFDLRIDGMRLLGNQKGKPREKVVGYQKNLTITL